MINIFVGVGVIAGATTGHLSLMGSQLGIYAMGGFMIVMGIRKVILKQKRKKRELAKGAFY